MARILVIDDERIIRERVSALLFHLGASVFVYKSVRERNLLWLLVGILGHTMLNAMAVIAVQQMSILMVEVLLFAFALIWVSWAWLVRPEEQPEDQLAPPPPKPALTASKVSTDQIEESRYE